MRSLRILLLAAIAGGSLATAWADDPPAAAKQPPQEKAAPASPPLSLAPPDIHKILPPQDLEGTIDDPDAPEEPPPEVKVSGDKTAPVIPNNQIAALWWGFTHPTQAWRILAPVQ